MARKIVPPQPRQTKPPVATPPPGPTLADVTVTHTVGSHVTKVAGGDLARLLVVFETDERLDATRHLHDRDEASDFLDATRIAIELNGMAEVLIDLMDDDEPCALSYLSDQLPRLSNRVAASAPRCGNSAPNWYAVEVKK